MVKIMIGGVFSCAFTAAHLQLHSELKLYKYILQASFIQNISSVRMYQCYFLCKEAWFNYLETILGTSEATDSDEISIVWCKRPVEELRPRNCDRGVCTAATIQFLMEVVMVMMMMIMTTVVTHLPFNWLREGCRLLFSFYEWHHAVLSMLLAFTGLYEWSCCNLRPFDYMHEYEDMLWYCSPRIGLQ